MARSQAPSFQSTASSPETSLHVNYNPDDTNEAMTFPGFSDCPVQEVFGYFGGDFAGTEVPLEQRKEQFDRFKLFGRKAQHILQQHATHAARLFLGGEEHEIKEALDIVKKHPDILRCHVTARNRVGSPALCVMPDGIAPQYHVRLSEEEHKIEPNTLYVGIDENKNLYYKVEVQTLRGKEVITAPIQANKLLPPLDLSQELTPNTLERYQSQILKLAANRGDIDNKLYLQLTEAGNLTYTVLNPEGEYVQGILTPAELKQERIQAPLTQKTLTMLQGDILEITAKRGHTPLGGEAKGTLLQIAVKWAGDVDLQPEIKDEKDHGVAEQLIAMGQLSKEEVAEQLDVILNDKAQLNNEIKNHRILAAIKKLADGICKMNTDGIRDRPDEYSKFRALQSRCQLLIDDFEEELRSDPNHVIDIGLLHQVAVWFEKKETLAKFGGLYSPQSDVFWVALGLVQKNKLSTRDRHATNFGIGRVVDEGRTPPRSENTANGAAHWCASSRFGRDFYLGYYGPLWGWGGPDLRAVAYLVCLCRSKTAALQNLRSGGQKRAGVR